MTRLPVARRENAPLDQQAHFDELVKENGSVPSHGPTSLLAHAPKAWRLEKNMRDYFRYKSALSGEIVELVILIAARELDCQFVWNSHAGPAQKAGLSRELVEALRDRKELPSIPDVQRAVINYGREFFRTHRVSRGAHQNVLDHLQERGLVELSLLFGNYCMLAFLLNANDADLRPNRDEALLPVLPV